MSIGSIQGGSGQISSQGFSTHSFSGGQGGSMHMISGQVSRSSHSRFSQEGGLGQGGIPSSSQRGFVGSGHSGNLQGGFVHIIKSQSGSLVGHGGSVSSHGGVGQGGFTSSHSSGATQGRSKQRGSISPAA